MKRPLLEGLVVECAFLSVSGLVIGRGNCFLVWKGQCLCCLLFCHSHQHGTLSHDDGNAIYSLMISFSHLICSLITIRLLCRHLIVGTRMDLMSLYKGERGWRLHGAFWIHSVPHPGYLKELALFSNQLSQFQEKIACPPHISIPSPLVITARKEQTASQPH